MNGTAAQKLLGRMRRSSSGWGQRDFEHLFSGFGFRWKEGLHRKYYHPDFPDLWISIPRHKTLKEWVTRDAVGLIDELISRQTKGETKL